MRLGSGAQEARIGGCDDARCRPRIRCRRRAPRSVPEPRRRPASASSRRRTRGTLLDRSRQPPGERAAELGVHARRALVEPRTRAAPPRCRRGLLRGPTTSSLRAASGAQDVQRRRRRDAEAPCAAPACRRPRPRAGRARAPPRRGCCPAELARPRARGSRRARRRRGSTRPGSRGRSRRPCPAAAASARTAALVASPSGSSSRSEHPARARARACRTDPSRHRPRAPRACAPPRSTSRA